jgi:DNA-binding transcriptional LysR family regulator
MNIDLEGLRGFVSVAELGSFHDAAAALAVSPSALTRRVRRLEEAMDTQLFDRTTRRVGLTGLGREFLPKARRVLEDLEASLQAIQDTSARRSGQITVACIPTAAHYFLPKVIVKYTRTFPLIRIRILEEGASQVINSVRNAEADLGLTFLGGRDGDLEFETVTEDPYFLACRHDHPLARQETVAWQDLKPYRFVTAGRMSGNRLVIDQALRGAGWAPDWFYEVQHLPTSIGLIEAGLAVAALPQMALPGAGHPAIVSRPLLSPAVTRTIGVIRRKGVPLSTLAAPFLDCLRDCIRDIV